MVFLTSCDARRYGQWEHVSWWDFIDAETKSEEYQKVLAAGLTRNLVAAKETVASTRTIGNMGEAFVYNIMGRRATTVSSTGCSTCRPTRRGSTRGSPPS